MRPSLVFDGKGINGPDKYRSRVATFQADEDATKHGHLFAASGVMYEALLAINAVYRGDWDNPALIKYGPLEVERKEVVLRIARAAIAQAEERGR